MIDIPPEPPGPKDFLTKAFLIGPVLMSAIWIVGLLLFG